MARGEASDGTSERALLEAIAADPADAEARLVYADFLEERGERARAEEVRALVGAAIPCLACAHFEWSSLDADRCAAFPGGIDRAILLARVYHDVPTPRDGGLRFTLSLSRAGATRRHDAWRRVRLSRALRREDPLGAIVSALEEGATRPPGGARAWEETRDAIAAFVVALRVGEHARALQALERTERRLALEGCDARDDKGWLGGARALYDVRRELGLGRLDGLAGRLAGRFRSDYVEARLHATLLASLRLAWPSGPAEEHFTRWADAPDLGWAQHPTFLLELSSNARGGGGPT